MLRSGDKLQKLESLRFSLLDMRLIVSVLMSGGTMLDFHLQFIVLHQVDYFFFNDT